MINVGAAIVDVTPPDGLAMAGFAARINTAISAHDPLTVRALVVDNMALVTVDVIGIDAALSRRVRHRCVLPANAVTIAATHTHGGPGSMPGRLWISVDAAYMIQLEDSIVSAIDCAAAKRQPARPMGGTGVNPGYAKNRRQTDGPVDGNLPVVRFDATDGTPIAIVTSYACHPVVLAADNLKWTGDYPHYVREELEAAYLGTIALFATGCAGDVNTGHTAASSLSIEANPQRNFSTAKNIGVAIAQAVQRVELKELIGGLGCSETTEQLHFAQREVRSPDQLAHIWRTRADNGDAELPIWADWAERFMGKNVGPLTARCTAFNWCGAQIVAMPGEIFAQTAIEIRQSLSSSLPLFVLAYADDNPGYVPHRDAFAEGGYEVDEAHRFYGQGATFAPGSAERLADAGCKAARMATSAATDAHSN